MKRGIISVISAVAICLSAAMALPAAAEPVSDGYDLLKFSDDFEDFTNPDDMATIAPQNWLKFSSDIVLPYQYEDEEHNIVAALKSVVASTGKRLYINPTHLSADKSFAKAKIEFELYVPDTNAVSIQFMDPNNTRQTILRLAANGNIMKNMSGTLETIGTYERDRWNSFTLYVDCDKKLLTVYMNDVLIAENMEIVLIPIYLNSLSFETAARVDLFTYIDNVKIYTPVPLETESVFPSDGCEDFPRIDGKIEFLCNRAFMDYDNTALTLTDSEGIAFTGFETVKEDNKLTVLINEMLKAETEYTVTFGDNSFTLKTSADKLAAGMPEIKTESGTVSAQVNVKNEESTKKEATLVLGAYSSQNTLLAMQTASAEIESGAEKPLSVSIALPTEEYSVRAFTVDNMSDLNMLRSDFAGAESFSFSGLGKAELKLESVVASDNTIIIDSALQAAGERCVLLTATDEDDILNYISPIVCGEDGVLKYSFAPASGDGVYKLSFGGRKLAADAHQTVNFISIKTQDDILSETNGASSQDKTGEVLLKYKAALNMSDEYFCENSYLIVNEQKPYTEFLEISRMLVKAKTTLEQVNAASWSTLSEVIASNEDILMHGNSDYSYYKNLSASEKNKINKVIKKTYETIADFRQAFSEAVDDYKDSLNTQSTSTRSSGGGGGGGGTSSVVVSVAKPEETPQAAEPVEEKPVFDDLDSVQWAKEGIEELNKRGIVSGDGNGSFRPLDKITREEFVKLLVNAFEIAESTNDCTFTDVRPDTWYAPFLAAAQQAGILTGKPDGSFGVGESITRQDMAVMIYRTTETLGKVLEQKSDSTEFSDYDDISDYAKNAVDALYAAEIVSGAGGSFSPTQCANRAEASTIIFNLYNKGVAK